ncbi:MAG: hypothetical protein Hyperionvirus15_63, partial [Hyperionvirus sp.]
MIWGSNSQSKRKFDVVYTTDETNAPRRKAKVTKKEKEKSEVPSEKDILSPDNSTNGGASGGLIYSRNNHVYFYSDVTLSTITTLQKEIDSVIETLSSKSLLVKILDFDIKY